MSIRDLVCEYRECKPKRGFTLIELLVVMAIIGILTAVVMASINEAKKKAGEPQPPDKQEQAQNICVKQGGVPILNEWGRMEKCQFKIEQVGALPPCNASDVPNAPADVIRQIEDSRKGACI